MGSTRGRGKAAMAANASAAAKAVARASRQVRPQKGAKAAGKWKLIPSSEATFEAMAAQPNATVVLSDEEGKWRDSIERSARDDPDAYYAALRSED
jgi:hypothetical protein